MTRKINCNWETKHDPFKPTGLEKRLIGRLNNQPPLKDGLHPDYAEWLIGYEIKRANVSGDAGDFIIKWTIRNKPNIGWPLSNYLKIGSIIHTYLILTSGIRSRTWVHRDYVDYQAIKKYLNGGEPIDWELLDDHPKKRKIRY